MSIARWLGLPDAFVLAVMLLTLALTLAPYFSGMTIGSVQVPRLDIRRRRALRLIGPVLLLANLALVLPLSALNPMRTNLRLAAAEVTERGEIDLVVINSGSSAALLTAIEIEILADRGVAARPVLVETATYRVPIDGVRAGSNRRRMIRHLIPAGASERIVIAPETARALRIRVVLHAEDGTALSATLELLPLTQPGQR
ncbi:MAG TPA: hypothetical protein VHW00_19965 [Thermoanaerobaculia bacterium]|nr:hypothetical protein [Thermoanaerobaculia bacterium]